MSTSYGPLWRFEKASHVLLAACDALKYGVSKDVGCALSHVIWDASKLLCEAAQDHYGDTHRWSPELSDYLIQCPEKAKETIEIVFSQDYRDDYYSKTYK